MALTSQTVVVWCVSMLLFLTIAVSYILVVIDWLLFQVFSCPCSCLILRLILQMYTAKAAAALAASATAENQPFNHLLEALKVFFILRFEGRHLYHVCPFVPDTCHDMLFTLFSEFLLLVDSG